jgi:hypothetical protein
MDRAELIAQHCGQCCATVPIESMAVPSPLERRSTSPLLSAWCHLHPGQSPESNSIAKTFAGTFKRDYARVHPLPDVAAVLRQIVRWLSATLTEGWNDLT